METQVCPQKKIGKCPSKKGVKSAKEARMKSRIVVRKSRRVVAVGFLCVVMLFGLMMSQALAVMSGFDASKMSDMSDFDPNNQIVPTGDTIKIGHLETFSGPGALSGVAYSLVFGWVIHDINKRGGILVDGKKKKIQIVKADAQGKPATTKKAAEKLCLEEKVDVIVGVTGSHLCLVAQNVADKHKVIFVNYAGYSDSLMDGKNFNRYTFRIRQNTSMFSALGYFYSKRPENKFYILNQDYSFGHSFADAFKKGLKQYKPDAVIVGEEYHPLFLKDFAPYLTKIQGSDADVIVTSDWGADVENLIKQSKSLGIKLPIAGYETDHVSALESIGGPAGVGIVVISDNVLTIDTPEQKALVKSWSAAWEKWEKPYNHKLWKYPFGPIGAVTSMGYWLMDVIERAGTTDAEKIIALWEGDEYKAINGMTKMRACDHQVIRDMYVTELGFPTSWSEDYASYTAPFVVPAEHCMPPVPDDLERCKK